jgi:NAD(P)H-hydrate repair Nnr-like enzyme with NAD(P)H-hydrate epimerase domain
MIFLKGMWNRKWWGWWAPGNNGGDTLVALAALAAEGWKARAYLVKRKKDDLVKRFLEAGGEVLSGENAFENWQKPLRTRMFCSMACSAQVSNCP